VQFRHAPRDEFAPPAAASVPGLRSVRYPNELRGDVGMIKVS